MGESLEQGAVSYRRLLKGEASFDMNLEKVGKDVYLHILLDLNHSFCFFSYCRKKIHHLVGRY